MLSKRHFLCVYMFLALLIPSVSFSQDQETKDYKVNSGDTLWNISGKELGDPFLWPKVWQENPEIANPDRIYPGQTIRIPLRYVQKEEQEKPAGIEPPAGQPAKREVVRAAEPPVSAKLRPLVDKNTVMASGFIADTVAGTGNIMGAPDRIMFGNDDIVYVGMDKPVKAGDRFYIVRNGGIVRHPVTNKKIGYVVEMRGVIEVLRFEDGDITAKITKIFNDVYPGDLLVPYYEISAPMTTGDFRKPEVTGFVIASRYDHLGNAKLNVVYIDKGLKDGLDVGDIVKTVNIVDGHKVATGSIQIINCQNATSTALVLQNYSGPITVGNLLTKLE